MITNFRFDGINLDNKLQLCISAPAKIGDRLKRMSVEENY